MAFLQLKFNIPYTENINNTNNIDQYEKISQILEDSGALSVTFQDAEDQPIYEPLPGTLPLWHHVTIQALFPEDCRVSEVIKKLNLVLSINNINYNTSKISDKNWGNICREDFSPLKFGEQLWICPSWHHITVPGAVIISLDPGMAFGTGTHPTTRLCLEWLAQHQTEISQKTMIDYGCGSGILGIAALKLGAGEVTGIDFCPQALLASQENALKNQVKLNTFTPEEFKKNLKTHINILKPDIIIANILANPLIELRDIFFSLLKTRGTLILSGILEEQMEIIKKAYQYQFEIVSSTVQEEWARMEFLSREAKQKTELNTDDKNI